MENAPTLWAVLTAREHLTRKQTYRHLEQLREAARRRWPDVEWFVQVEFQRRGALHLNLLIKGVPVEDAEQLRQVLVDRWCARVDAAPVGQWLDAIEDAGGAVRYLSKMLAHGLKAEQAPPIGWRGHRTSQTRGYLVRPASVMREEARRSLRFKRELWKLLSAHPEVDPVTADEVVADRLAWAEKRSYALVHLNLTPKLDPPDPLPYPEQLQYALARLDARGMSALDRVLSWSPVFAAVERDRPPRADVTSGPGSMGGGDDVPGLPAGAPRGGGVPACRSG
jgi:hypothetical protein